MQFNFLSETGKHIVLWKTLTNNKVKLILPTPENTEHSIRHPVGALPSRQEQWEQAHQPVNNRNKENSLKDAPQVVQTW